MLKKYSWLIIVIFLLVTSQLFYSHIKLLKQETAFDFDTLYTSGAQVLKGLNPYIQLRHDVTRNPPPTLLLYSAWALLPIKSAEIIWFATSTITFLFGSYYLIKICENLDINFFRTTNLYLWAIYLILVSIFFPFRWNLGSGQINNLLFMLLTISFYMFQKKKNFWGSLALSIGIAIKLTPLYFLFNFIIQKQFKQAVLTIISLIVILILTTILLGINVIRDYAAIPSLYLNFYTIGYHNQSLASFFARLFINPQFSYFLSIVCLMVGLIIFLYITHKYSKKDFTGEALSWNMSILYMLIFAPFTWKYHFVIAIFPLFTTTCLLSKSKLGVKTWVILTASYILMGYHFKTYPLNSFNYLQAITFSHVLIGAVVLLGLNFYLVIKLR